MTHSHPQHALGTRRVATTADGESADITIGTGQEIKRALVDDLRDCRWSRADVAAMLSEASGRRIGEHHIDAWTAETKDSYRMPADLVGLWCRITGSRRVLDVICGVAGLYAVDDTERDLAAFGRQRLREEKARIEGDRLKGDLWTRVR